MLSRYNCIHFVNVDMHVQMHKVAICKSKVNNAVSRLSGGPPGSVTPSQTPLRDQLNINPEEGVAGFESVKSARQQQFEIRAQLRAGLSSLPTPKNDFEIVVPEDEGGMETEEGSGVDPTYVEDAAEVDERRAKALKQAGLWREREVQL